MTVHTILLYYRFFIYTGCIRIFYIIGFMVRKFVIRYSGLVKITDFIVRHKNYKNFFFQIKGPVFYHIL